jgi:hypothetical protein
VSPGRSQAARWQFVRLAARLSPNFHVFEKRSARLLVPQISSTILEKPLELLEVGSLCAVRVDEHIATERMEMDNPNLSQRRLIEVICRR